MNFTATRLPDWKTWSAVMLDFLEGFEHSRQKLAQRRTTLQGRRSPGFEAGGLLCEAGGPCVRVHVSDCGKILRLPLAGLSEMPCRFSLIPIDGTLLETIVAWITGALTFGLFGPVQSFGAGWPSGTGHSFSLLSFIAPLSAKIGKPLNQ